MKYRWSLDERYPDDLDLEVLHADDDWHIIAFIRFHSSDATYMCNFMDMLDNEFPDGVVYKTKRAAKKFCERHLPAMWIMRNAKTGDDK